MRTLILDIETATLLAHVFQLKVDYISPEAVTHETFMLCWAAKWEGKPKMVSDVLTGHEAVAQDDSRIVQSLADLIREADVVVAHNGDRFDIPMLNNRLLLLGLEPLGPVKTIDTLTLARKSFRLASNRLDYVATRLGVGSKLPTSFDLWRQCYQGDEQALARMVKYNRHDVKILESVYHRLKPYVKGLPRLVDGEMGKRGVCPSCGEDSLQRRGYHRTNASTFQRLVCTACGRWCRERVAEKAAKLAHVPL